VKFLTTIRMERRRNASTGTREGLPARAQPLTGTVRLRWAFDQVASAVAVPDAVCFSRSVPRVSFSMLAHHSDKTQALDTYTETPILLWYLAYRAVAMIGASPPPTIAPS
jgi:hypothetical protein